MAVSGDTPPMEICLLPSHIKVATAQQGETMERHRGGSASGPGPTYTSALQDFPCQSRRERCGSWAHARAARRHGQQGD